MTKKQKQNQNQIVQAWKNMPSIFVNHPKKVVFIIYPIAIILMVVAFSLGFKLDSKNAGFTIRSGEDADNYHGSTVNTKETYFDYETYEKETEKYDQQTQTGWYLIFYYECDGCDNLLTKEKLAQIYQFEQEIQKEKNYGDYCKKNSNGECNSPYSVTSFFYDSDGEQKDDFDQAAEDLYNMPGQMYKMFCDKDFSDSNLKTKYLKSSFFFGSPLEGYKNKLDNFDTQTEIVEEYIVDSLAPIMDENKEEIENKQVLTYYIGTGITSLFVNELIIHDVSLVTASIFMVFIYTWFHTKSLFLTSTGLFGVMLSFGCSYFIYRVILGVQYFNMMNFLALFIILGIGCDSLYIMLDSWRQSTQYLDPKDHKNLTLRMNRAYFRAAETMFITTITSVGAFFGNLASSIPAIKYFGFFTGMAIIFNYFFVITAFPSLIIIWTNLQEKNLFLCKIIFRCCKKKKANKHKDKKKKKKKKNEKTQDSDDVELKDKDKFTDCEDRGTSENKSQSDSNRESSSSSSSSSSSAHGSTIIFILCAGFLSYQTSKLEASEDPSQFLPDDHEMMRALNIEDQELYATTSIISANYIWGITGIDRSGVDPLEADNYGEVIYDKKFSVKTKEQQNYIITVCGKLRKQSFVEDGSVFCFMEDFRDWVTNDTLTGGSYNFPVEEDDFKGLLLDFTDYARDHVVNKGSGSGYRSVPAFLDGSIRFDRENNELRTVALIFNVTLSRRDPASKSRPIYDLMDEFKNTINKDAPTGLTNSVQICGKWLSMITEENLSKVAISSIIISLAIAYIILLVSTNNLLTSFFAFLSIGGVVVTIIGMIVSLGWQLGIIESTCLTVIVGISVDYIVHFCHAYEIAPETNRYKKYRTAITNLGISVVSAAITTLLASSVLFFTFVAFFKNFGIFILITVLASVFWSFFFFFVLLAIAGSVDNRWKISRLIRKITKNKKDDDFNGNNKKKKKKEKPSDNKIKNTNDKNFVDIENQSHNLDSSNKKKNKVKKSSKDKKTKKKKKKLSSSENPNTSSESSSESSSASSESSSE
ncbi:sterol-sensing domain [Anaeramoeba flamelloides]|uniref:Sterol-sensing domain n=1 Tax=Anaeramoeba flamelloides TaxID=1746091 RepID=A0AAV7YGW6_9EUKA|nr:sterol-sensing domain [Anaeramoeba flamelloides]